LGGRGVQAVDGREMVRRLLPWYLLHRFRNVVLAVEVEEEEGRGVARVREVELYVSPNAPYVFVPGASMMLYAPFIRARYEVAASGSGESEVVISGVEGFVAGFLPNGRYAKYTEKAFGEGVVGKRVKVRGEPDQFDIDVVAAGIARIVAGGWFAANIKTSLSREGWEFEPFAKGALKVITVAERRAEAEVSIMVRLFKVRYGGREVTAPGIVPGVAAFFADDRSLPIADAGARDALIGFVKGVADVGRHFASLALLQRTARSTFTYTVGEASVPKAVREHLMKRSGGSGRLWLAGGRLHRGVRADFYLDLEGGGVVSDITIYPFSPPATLVLNYPPFNMAPLAATLHEQPRRFARLAELASKRLDRYRVEGALYVKELEPLAEAGVKFDDIKKALREGYPKLDTLEALLGKMDRVSYLGDVASMAYGRARRVDELLIASITPIEEKRGREGASITL